MLKHVKLSGLWVVLLGVGVAAGVTGFVPSANGHPVGSSRDVTRSPSTSPAEVPVDSFPHIEHQGLFPLCQGCHEGIDTDADVLAMPDPQQCTGCHNGVEREVVEWSPPVPQVGVLSFSHPDHVQEVLDAGDSPLACASCHVAEGGRSMEIVPLEAGRCLTCHEVEPDAHYEPTTDCTQCHNPVAAAWDGETRIAEMERPLNHRGRDFLLEVHGERALEATNRCATCHVEDQCASCHVDASLQPIPQVPSAPSTWETPVLAAEYPIPSSHDPEGFLRDHGWPAPNAADCSTCHTRDDCASCHLEPLPLSARELQERPQVRAPGVGLAEQLPASHDSPFFLPTHPVLASSGPSGCNSCHTQAYCAECHDAPATPGYHPPSFALRHTAATSTQPMECSNCHSVAAFCRECHVEMGLESVGRLGPGFHDAEPVWLLRHGGAARQGMEQCASCHEQRDCLQCHSTIGAFQISPHGPDFDPAAAEARNALICRACHVGGFS